MHENNETLADLFADTPVIYSYSRADMIRDGFLIEVPDDLRKEAGFKFPVGVLVEAWAECVAWTKEDSERQVPQDETGRLWDILMVLREAAKRCSGDTVYLTVARIPRDGKSIKTENIRLKAIIGPGDDPKPVLTIMTPDQD